MNESDEAGTGIDSFSVDVVYQADPFARLLIERFKLGKRAAALAGLVWSLIFLFILPAMSGSLWSRQGYLGSLKDWHAQLLLLLVFPAACAFYLWQPGAIASVYGVILGGGAARQEPPHGRGRLYRRAIWSCLSLVVALAVVAFDAPKMVANYGSWWMTSNWLTIAVREASLAVSFYMMSMMAWRQLIATIEWNRLLARPSTPTVLRAVTTYELGCAFLMALVGLRLSIEGIELPTRAGAITPDYYVKIATYVAVVLACFFAPIASVPWGGVRGSLSLAINLLKLAGIMALPLLAFVVLKVVL
jgi:hypothetical protein